MFYVAFRNTTTPKAPSTPAQGLDFHPHQHRMVRFREGASKEGSNTRKYRHPSFRLDLHGHTHECDRIMSAPANCKSWPALLAMPPCHCWCAFAWPQPATPPLCRSRAPEQAAAGHATSTLSTNLYKDSSDDCTTEKDKAPPLQPHHAPTQPLPASLLWPPR
jgi:hypothetical protein